MALELLHNLLEKLTAERQAELLRRQESGVPIVGYLCCYVPRELITAAGAIPIRLTAGGDYQNRTRGEKYLRADACPFCRCCIGEFETNPLYRWISVLIVPSTCDQLRRLAEVIHQRFTVLVWQLALPRTFSSASRELFRREVRWLCAELERLVGSEVTGAVLARAMLQQEEQRLQLRAMNELRKSEAPLVSQTDILLLTAAFNLLSADDCRRLLDQYRLRLKLYAGSRRPQRPRLLLAGSIIAEQDRQLVTLIEQQADIVADLLCTGTRSFIHPLEIPLTQERDDLLMVLADYYFDQTCCLQRRPNTGYYTLARRLIQDYRVSGIVYKTLIYCDSYQLEALQLEKELGLPFLMLDTDYGPGNVEQLRTRVEAFIELLGG